MFILSRQIRYVLGTSSERINIFNKLGIVFVIFRFCFLLVLLFMRKVSFFVILAIFGFQFRFLLQNSTINLNDEKVQGKFLFKFSFNISVIFFQKYRLTINLNLGFVVVT